MPERSALMYCVGRRLLRPNMKVRREEFGTSRRWAAFPFYRNHHSSEGHHEKPHENHDIKAAPLAIRRQALFRVANCPITRRPNSPSRPEGRHHSLSGSGKMVPTFSEEETGLMARRKLRISIPSPQRHGVSTKHSTNLSSPYLTAPTNRQLFRKGRSHVLLRRS
jgi:hypothetical protein